MATDRLPLPAQYLAMVLPRIPESIRARPGSREFRAELRAISVETGILPTRRETAAACSLLSRLAARDTSAGDPS
jgi:hypothetical protein